MSVVSALSGWLIHTNQRRDGAWTQRYERGIPVTDLDAIPEADRSGATVRFLPDVEAGTTLAVSTSELAAPAGWPHLTVEVMDERAAEILD
jgi:topoisomerase IV subunit B